MSERSNYQEKVIKRFYKNRDQIATQRLQEAITDLYLAEGKKRQQMWKRVATHLQTVGVAEKTIDHLIKQDDPAAVAKLLEELL